MDKTMQSESFPGGSDSKESTYNAGYLHSWVYLLQEGMVTHSSVLALRIPMDRGA